MRRRSHPAAARAGWLGPRSCALIAYPLVASPFCTVQIGAQSLFLGVIALSLMFLAGYGGMVSLSQMTVAGVAGYAVAIFGTSSTHPLFGWPWWLAVLLAHRHRHGLRAP